MADPALIQRHWSGRLQLELRSGPDRTRLVPLSRCGPLSVQRPFYPEGECCHVYVLHPPGGVVGGDRLELMVQARTRAQGLFTTPGVTKFYRSAGDTARIRHRHDLKADTGITRSYLLVINKVDSAPYVGASLEVVEQDTKKMRIDKPFVFTNLKTDTGLDVVIEFLIDRGMLDADTAQAGSSG